VTGRERRTSTLGGAMTAHLLCCADCDESRRDPLRNDYLGDMDELELGVGVAIELVAENIDGAALWRELAIRGRFRRVR